MRIASFDIGKKNFAFYIEEFDEKKLKENMEYSTTLSSLRLKKNRFNTDGTPNSEYASLLNTIYKNGKMILHKNTDLTANCDAKKQLDDETYYNMYNLLNEYLIEWKQCDYFIVEEQMNFGKRRNPMAQKLAQHCISFFINLFLSDRNKKIIEFPSYHKTQVLGAPKQQNKKGKFVSMSQRNRKKWSVEKMEEIIKIRGEERILESNIQIPVVDSKNTKRAKKTPKPKKIKLDDLADTLIQAQAWKVLFFLG